jgi:hypothetical protein
MVEPWAEPWSYELEQAEQAARDDSWRDALDWDDEAGWVLRYYPGPCLPEDVLLAMHDAEAERVGTERFSVRGLRTRRLAREAPLVVARLRPLPWTAWMAAWVLALLKAEQLGTPAPVPLDADHRPANDLAPPVAYVRARTVLTAAPPRSRAPVLAGAA